MSWRDGTQELSRVIDTLAAVDPASMGARDLSGYLEELNRQLRRLDCVRHVATGQFEVSGYLLDLGYRSLAQWHRDRLHMSTPAAGRIGSLARSLVHMPTVAKYWADGNLDAEAARAIASLRTEVTEALFDEAEGYLAAAAAGCDHYDLRRVCREWLLRADPDGTDPAERDRDAHVCTTFQGAVRVDANLEPVGGACFKDTFDAIVNEFFNADWKAAKEQLGRDPKVSELVRTHAERRHDALVEMATRARNYRRAARPRPLVTVVTGLPALADGLARLWNDVPLSPTQLADLLAQDPDTQRYTYGSQQQPIRYNPKARLYTGKLREAILTRDRRCTGLGCTADTRWGAVDHIHPHANGGQTTPGNGRGACHPCNRTRPQRRFTTDPPREPPDHDP